MRVLELKGKLAALEGEAEKGDVKNRGGMCLWAQVEGVWQGETEALPSPDTEVAAHLQHIAAPASLHRGGILGAPAAVHVRAASTPFLVQPRLVPPTTLCCPQARAPCTSWRPRCGEAAVLCCDAM